MKWLLPLFFASSVHAATFTAASVSRTDVETAIGLASDGDTILIPAGSSHWTTNLDISKSLSVIGAGTNNTTIFDDIPNGSDSLGTLASVIRISVATNKFFRLSAINFPSNTVRSSALATALITVLSDSKAIRIDHLNIACDAMRTRGITWYNSSCGLMDHIWFSCHDRSFDVFHATWGGKQFGDGSWQDNDTYGTTNTVVCEDSYFQGNSSTDAFTDGFDGARYCVRYCISTNGHWDSHEGGSRTRSTRQIEIYMNQMGASDANGLILSQRGGTSVVWSNTCVGFVNGPILYNFRSDFLFNTWGSANGTNIWDNNRPLPASETGTFNGVNGSTTTMTDSTKTWTVNQWVGYQVQNDAASQSNSFGRFFGLITANTSTSLTTKAFAIPSNQVTWTNGDHYSIYFITNGFDMCGMGKESVIFDNNDPPSPAGWPQQAVSPCYAWGNTPSNLKMVTSYPIIREGVHFTNDVVKPGYTPLVYPHPLNTDVPPRVANVTTVNVGTIIMRGP